jgi:hypothetical protein
VNQVTPGFIAELDANFAAIGAALVAAVSPGSDGNVTLPGALNEQASSLASTATVTIGAANGNYIAITGTTQITAFDVALAGVRRTLKFAGSLTIVHSGIYMILPGAANIATAAGDIAEFVSEGFGNWRCIRYQRATGDGLIPTGSIRVDVGQISLNSSNTDYPVAIKLPAGHLGYRLSSVVLYGASGNISTGTIGLYSGAGATGVAMIAAGTAIAITTAAAATSLGSQTIPNAVNMWFDATANATLYLRVGTAIAGATVRATIILTPQP